MVTTSHGPTVHADGTTTFRVWAPLARAVELAIDDRQIPLDPVAPDDPDAPAHGWHRVRTTAAAGARYAYRLDGGPERPDPASRHQPDGVHERSAVVDTSTFSWTDHEFRPTPLPAAVIYELHIGTFTAEGTFAAAVGRLDDLRDLGITHVEVLPVNAFNGDRGWGYDGVGWYAVHEPYGGPTAFAEFVDACHQRGLSVLLDVVYNHQGPSGNYLGEFGPYLTERYATPWGQAPNVDGPGADHMRSYIVDNALMWLDDYHVDGLRLDAVHGIVDISSRHILAELSAATDALAERCGRDLALVAETDRQDPQTVRPRAVGGTGLAGQWVDDLHHAIHTALTGESEGYYVDYDGLTDVAAVYARGYAYDGRWSRFRRRTIGAPLPDDVSSRRLVTCVQNHDQVGNRARGDRLTTLVDPARLRVGIALLCCSPTTPMLFMGDEFGATTPFQFFSGHPEPELDAAVREGRRAEFESFADFAGEVPDPQDPATMAASRLDWSQAATPEGLARRRLWRDLLALRGEPGLADGDRSTVEVVDAGPQHLVVIRHGGPGWVVAANLTADDLTVDVPGGVGVPRWSSDDHAYGGQGRTVTVHDGSAHVPPATLVLFPRHPGSTGSVTSADAP
jgi:maltooligosyltrehalose trehalohydrolase